MNKRMTRWDESYKEKGRGRGRDDKAGDHARGSWSGDLPRDRGSPAKTDFNPLLCVSLIYFYSLLTLSSWYAFFLIFILFVYLFLYYFDFGFLFYLLFWFGLNWKKWVLIDHVQASGGVAVDTRHSDMIVCFVSF